VAIGRAAGGCNQHNSTVAIGHLAGNYSQGQDAIAIGRGAGRYHQGQYAVAIGWNAGYGNCYSYPNCQQCRQQDYSIAIGYKAGYNYQNQHSIAINASSDIVNPDNQGLYINPVREDVGNTAHSVYYNTTTKELTYSVPASGVLPQSTQAANGDYTLVLSDIGKHIYKTGTGDIKIPTNASVAFPIGTTITLITGSTNPTHILPVDSGTTTLILSKFGADANINVPVDTYVTILKIETNKWMIQT